MLHRNGFSVFLMDLRDHGDSEGDDARFAGGSEEYMDVLGGWDWVRSQGVPAARIGLLGHVVRVRQRRSSRAARSRRSRPSGRTPRYTSM